MPVIDDSQVKAVSANLQPYGYAGSRCMAVHIRQSLLDDTQTALLYGRGQAISPVTEPERHA
jgi:hypothetical protein